VSETTAYGAACLAALGCGLLNSLEEITGLWRKHADFQPTMPAPERIRLIAGWHDAVAGTLTTRA